MKHPIQTFTLLAGLLLVMSRAQASSDVDHMSDIEVRDYAVRMSEVMDKVQKRKICVTQDTRCVRAEFARHGVSYDDKASVQKRLSLMVGTLY